MTATTMKVIQWMLDTRPLWTVPEMGQPKAQMEEFKAAASRPLSLVSPSEQSAILRYYFVRDAKMSLASSLLKRLAIAKLCGVPWSAAIASKAANGKPCYFPASASGISAPAALSSNDNKPEGGKRIEFNVSHQAGIVVLVASVYVEEEAEDEGHGAAQPPVQLGTDVVCVNERDDYGRIDKEGLFAWMDMHSDVFAPSEMQALKMGTSQLDLPLQEGMHLEENGRDAISRCQYRGQRISWMDAAGKAQEIDPKMVIDAKLRRFYVLWCLREAYVKMTGEALLAEWLQELEFRCFKTPLAAKGTESNSSSLELGEVVTDFDIYLNRETVDDVTMELRAFGADYMVASAARLRLGLRDRLRVEFTGFVELVESDIYAIAGMG